MGNNSSSHENQKFSPTSSDVSSYVASDFFGGVMGKVPPPQGNCCPTNERIETIKKECDKLVFLWLKQDFESLKTKLGQDMDVSSLKIGTTGKPTEEEIKRFKEYVDKKDTGYRLVIDQCLGYFTQPKPTPDKPVVVPSPPPLPAHPAQQPTKVTPAPTPQQAPTPPPAPSKVTPDKPVVAPTPTKPLDGEYNCSKAVLKDGKIVSVTVVYNGKDYTVMCECAKTQQGGIFSDDDLELSSAMYNKLYKLNGGRRSSSSSSSSSILTSSVKSSISKRR